jgi:hypothetical protein
MSKIWEYTKVLISKIWQYIKALGKRLFQLAVQYPLAIAATVLLIVLAIMMAAFGKTFQIGGLLGKLWGKKQPDQNEILVIPPPGRVDSNGNPIPVGQSDSTGNVQVNQTMNIKDPGIFSDPNSVTIIHPTKGEVVIPLPTGVKNSDVRSVTEINPNCYQLHNNDKPSVDTTSLLNNLK